MNGFSPDWVLLTYTVIWSTSQCMKKERPSVEEFAAMIADRQDNPESYRDADRLKEAAEIPLTESQKRQAELEPIEGEEQDNPELFDWKEKYNKEHKLRQEAETETILVKGIGINSPEMRDANKKIEELRRELDRVKKENNESFNRIAELIEIDEAHQRLNGKLQSRITELDQDNLELHVDNKKISKQIGEQLERARKAGL